MKKKKELSEEKLQELKINTKYHKLIKLERKSGRFFYKLSAVLIMLQIFIGFNPIFTALILIMYLSFAYISLTKQKKKLSKEDYENLKSQLQVPVNRFGK